MLVASGDRAWLEHSLDSVHPLWIHLCFAHDSSFELYQILTFVTVTNIFVVLKNNVFSFYNIEGQS